MVATDPFMVSGYPCLGRTELRSEEGLGSSAVRWGEGRHTDAVAGGEQPAGTDDVDRDDGGGPPGVWGLEGS